MLRKTMRVAAAAAMVLATLLVPAPAAYAADGCGDGWYKESDGYLTRSHLWEGEGNRSAWIYHSGRVRFCTENDPFNDDENRKAIIGYTSDSYPFESRVDKWGNYSKFCVRQTIQARMTGIQTGQSWGLGGSYSKGDPGVSFEYSTTTETGTLTIARTRVCNDDIDRIVARVSGIIVTADNESGKIEWVSLTTTITAEYTINGTLYSDNHSVTEHDYSQFS
ncbi:MAG TPA: hypothetical protein VGX49_15880 [Jatrophihabitans sp.]|jgi:hypothetical protein|nr:hypothetical protein [Jatrophihabitans sp.]